MDGKAKRLIGIGALSVTVMVGAIGIASSNASGDEPNPAPPYPGFGPEPYGTLTLNLTGRTGSLTLALADETTVLTQAIQTTEPCATIALEPIRIQGDPTGNPYPGESLLDFQPLIGNPLTAGGTVQIPDGVLGVQSGTNCGTPAGQLGPSEALRLSLGNFDGFDAGSVTVESGTLAIGKLSKKDNALQIAYDTGGFGTAIDIAIGGTPVTSGAFADTITLKSTATLNGNGLSVNGGTVFNLVALATDPPFENAVDCDQTVTAHGTDPGDVASTAVFYRAFDNKGDEAVKCTDEVGVTVDISDEVVSWDNSTLGVNGTVQYVAGLVTIDWVPIDASRAPGDVAGELAREIDYDGTGGADFVPVQWCASFIELAPVDVDPDPDPDAVTLVRAFDVDMPTNAFDVDAGDVPWCLVSDTQRLVDGEILQTQVYYGQGDPQAR